MQSKQLEEHKKLALKLDQIAEQNDSRVEQFAKLLEAKDLECQLLTAKLNHQTQLTALEQKKAEGVALEMAQLKANEAVLKVCVQPHWFTFLVDAEAPSITPHWLDNINFLIAHTPLFYFLSFASPQGEFQEYGKRFEVLNKV